MSPFDRQRLLAALILVVMALFVASGAAPVGDWRRWFRRAAIIGFAIAAAVTIVEIALWWSGRGR